MQFKVPQNIDMEDKIVGSLTMIQFAYVLAGGLIDYILFQTISETSMALFLILAIPIGIIALGLAFLKIQDQPLSHFISAGISYLSNPKIRLWQRHGQMPSVFIDPPKPEKIAPITVKKDLEKSELDKLAYILDTQQPQAREKNNFGKITANFEKILKGQAK